MTGQSRSDDVVRSVGRAISLLQVLNRRPESTLHDLHCETGLPKPSILRILRTLEAKGLASKCSGYGRYRLLGGIKSLSSGFHHDPMIIEAGEKIMVDFTRSEGWPLMLAFFEIDAMVVRACTIRHTTLCLEQSSLNRRLSLFGDPLGRVYLAHSSVREQKLLLEILAHSADPEDWPARNADRAPRLLAAVREQGYAVSDPMIHRRSSTMAVPVLHQDRVVAALGLTWITAAMSQRKAIDHWLPRVRDTAEAISRAIGPGGWPGVEDEGGEGPVRDYMKGVA